MGVVLKPRVKISQIASNRMRPNKGVVKARVLARRGSPCSQSAKPIIIARFMRDVQAAIAEAPQLKPGWPYFFGVFPTVPTNTFRISCASLPASAPSMLVRTTTPARCAAAMLNAVLVPCCPPV